MEADIAFGVAIEHDTGACFDLAKISTGTAKDRRWTFPEIAFEVRPFFFCIFRGRFTRPLYIRGIPSFSFVEEVFSQETHFGY